MALSVRDIDNDTRGWIMCVVSGIACVVGASIICVDIIVRLFPGKRNFRIQDSNVFLACSLSLSFGVMIFSALYSMLPESKGYLKSAEWSDQAAGLLMMSCFIIGFIGIQAISRFLHQHIPTHVVDCDHTHDENAVKDANSCQHGRRRSRVSRARRRMSQATTSRPSTAKSISELHHTNSHGIQSETTPLLNPETNGRPPLSQQHGSGEMARHSPSHVVHRNRATTARSAPLDRRSSSILQVQKRVMSFVQDTKCGCDESGSCYGYTDPCGQECFKHLSKRSALTPRQIALRTTTGSLGHHPDHEHEHEHDECDEHGVAHNNGHHHSHASDSLVSPTFRTSRATSREPLDPTYQEEDVEHDASCSSFEESDDDLEAQHHHHVPTNAFLSIGLQTSIAIALHKFPEGFITYATNHANPTLGFNVFMALFVHNITEGFAMCLPLYMALGSRWRAMVWSAVLGGLSQPMGAGLAALWFKLASRTHMTPNAVAYACLFAATAGIMVSVGLQLFVESLSLNHNRNLCIFFGFLGMALLGVSNALVGSH
ncbi:Zinc/iron permease [Thelonectria olida]|uniref:Zinc/iron permease n=1 Tax=Thelonectria olida TaxID=1576542 RepID=A0A9P8WEW2_9HYPO|nr:Zinc/iron permease [Thelonectria olida]